MTEPACSCDGYVIYALTGDFDPDDVTRRTGVQPDDVIRKGEPRPHFRPRMTPPPYKPGWKNLPPFEVSEWSIKSRLPWQAPLNDHLEDVLNQLAPSWDQFVAYGIEINDMAVTVIIILHLSDCPAAHEPPIVLEKATLRRMDELNAMVNVDIY